jgi:hypothetical protein
MPSFTGVLTVFRLHDARIRVPLPAVYPTHVTTTSPAVLGQDSCLLVVSRWPSQYRCVAGRPATAPRTPVWTAARRLHAVRQSTMCMCACVCVCVCVWPSLILFKQHVTRARADCFVEGLRNVLSRQNMMAPDSSGLWMVTHQHGAWSTKAIRIQWSIKFCNHYVFQFRV